MKQRNLFKVGLLALITVGLYLIYWFVKTKGEINRSSEEIKIPTAWLIIVPIANLWWIWKYFVGVQGITQGKIKATTFFTIYLAAYLFYLVGYLPEFLGFSLFESDSVSSVISLMSIVSGLVIFFLPIYFQSHFNKLATADD